MSADEGEVPRMDRRTVCGQSKVSVASSGMVAKWNGTPRGLESGVRKDPESPVYLLEAAANRRPGSGLASARVPLGAHYK